MIDDQTQKGTLSRANAVSWRPPLTNSNGSRSVSPIPSYYINDSRNRSREEEQEEEAEPFPELEGDIPPGPLPPSPSRQQLPSQQTRRECEQKQQRLQPPRLNTTYLSLPPVSAHAPLSPPPLRIQKRGHAREGSLGLGLSSLSSSPQTGGPPASPALNQSNVLLSATMSSQLQPQMQTQAQRTGSDTLIASKMTLPPTPRAGRQSLSNGSFDQANGVVCSARGSGISLPSTPRPSVPPSPAYQTQTGPVAGVSPRAGPGMTPWGGEKIDKIKRVGSGGRARTPSSVGTSPPIPEYIFDEKVHSLGRSPSSTMGSREFRHSGTDGTKYPEGNDRYSGARTSTAVATRGRSRTDSLTESIWANRNPFGPVLRRDTNDNSVPSTPMDQEAAQHQRLRSDSIASTVTIAGMEYEYPQKYHCPSRMDVHVPRRSWLTVSLIVLSVYSTSMSGLWFFTSVIQPHWGHTISSDKHSRLQPSTASLLTTFFAKSIEMSFVTVFVGFLGQVLSRRAFIKDRIGITLSEISMKNWVVQPGALLTQWETVPYAGFTFLGVLSLLATISATLYTTASDAMVTPKLKFGGWREMPLTGFVRSSYSNPRYVRENCPTPITADLDPEGGAACLDVDYSGKSYHNLMAFMETWQGINANGTSKAGNIGQRPCGTAMLHDNTTVTSSWIQGEFSNVTAAFETFGRVVNNITLAMPHPGVYTAATNTVNGILQPHDLSGVGEYSIRASVVSPAVNVLCVNMDAEELAPLVYTEFPNARVNTTNIPGQVIGVADWERDIPAPSNTEFLNRTQVDNIFRWGPQFGRRPPVWRMFPIDSNIITNTTVVGTSKLLADAIYVLGKSPSATMAGNYTLCELRSWLATSCSTHFSISGTEGGELTAVCEKKSDPNRYDALNPGVATPKPSGDWKNMVDQWRLAIDLNGGIQNNNASNARILTRLAIDKVPDLDQSRDNAEQAERQGKEYRSGGLPALLPTMAEALAVLVSSTLMVGSIDTPFGAQGWPFQSHELGLPGSEERFNASIKSQEFVSGHTETWQGIVFYPILLILFLVNALCLCYLTTSLLGERGWRSTRLLARKTRFWHKDNGGGDAEGGDSSFARTGKMCADKMPCASAPGGLVTDYTDPSNLFALAINSPPSRQLAGSCGAGPRGRELVVPFRVGYQEKGNHYYFEEASDTPARGRWRGRTLEEKEAMGTGSSYRNLSVSKSWL